MTHDEFVKGRLFELYQMRAVVLAEIAQLEGRSPDGSGHSAKPEPCSTVSALRVSIASPKEREND